MNQRDAFKVLIEGAEELEFVKLAGTIRESAPQEPAQMHLTNNFERVIYTARVQANTSASFVLLVRASSRSEIFSTRPKPWSESSSRSLQTCRRNIAKRSLKIGRLRPHGFGLGDT
jgi:hypothetical protein